ncbi:hypothetical protein [Paludisphaera rhizosphaerae]|uniref:hypothetical protein n=1 Tax=Paludisphaera rhizosphaerae TaxID=2711216 RepID=UPI0013EA9914|nr:hypothetical protein [Paludisphaera rhizosphaerae]
MLKVLRKEGQLVALTMPDGRRILIELGEMRGNRTAELLIYADREVGIDKLENLRS